MSEEMLLWQRGGGGGDDDRARPSSSGNGNGKIGANTKNSNDGSFGATSTGRVGAGDDSDGNPATANDTIGVDRTGVAPFPLLFDHKGLQKVLETPTDWTLAHLAQVFIYIYPVYTRMIFSYRLCIHYTLSSHPLNKPSQHYPY